MIQPLPFLRHLPALRRVWVALLMALTSALSLSTVSTVSAQWITQTNQLKAGWNAVSLFVDASHAPISDVMPSDGSV
jgi:hypothetical protein